MAERLILFAVLIISETEVLLKTKAAKKKFKFMIRYSIFDILFRLNPVKPYSPAQAGHPVPGIPGRLHRP